MKGAALITGATGGIGYELAKLFAQNGHNLVLVARDKARLETVAQELASQHGVQVQAIAKDLARANSAPELFDQVRHLSIRVDVLVNNAGVGLYGLFAQEDPAAELEMLQLNVLSLTQLARLFLPEMLSRGAGRILNVASTAAFQPGPLMAAYYASKAYVLSFSEALANELRGTGVTISVLCPGPTATGFQKRADMLASKLFERGVMDASTVAAAGYRGLMRNKTLVIPGWRNKLLAVSVRLPPRSWIPAMVPRLQEKRQ